MVRSQPDRVWERLLVVVARTDDAGLFWVADLLEDLVAAIGGDIVDRLEIEMRSNARLRRAFTHLVPGHADAAIEGRLLVLREQIERDAAADPSSS